MKRLILFLFMILSFNLFSQDYPKIELNESGEKVVVFTLEQTQKIDNDLELLDLLKMYKFQCDTLNISYVKLIDLQSKEILNLRNLSETLQRQIDDKDSQLLNQQQQMKNYELSLETCNKQNSNSKEEIDGLKKDVEKSLKKGRRQGALVGFLTGFVVTTTLMLVK